MDPALTVAVVPAAITAAGTVPAAVIRAWRTGPDGSRPEAPEVPRPVSRRGHMDECQAEIGADGMPGRKLRPGDGR